MALSNQESYERIKKDFGAARKIGWSEERERFRSIAERGKKTAMKNEHKKSSDAIICCLHIRL